MATVRNSLSMKLKGRAGAYSFYSSKGRQIARVAQNSSNYGESARRSLAQQSRRVKWANLVNFWKGARVFLKGSFTSKRANETDYNAFMRMNLASSTVALKREEAAKGLFVPAYFKVSDGILPPITGSWGKTGDDDIFLTTLQDGGSMITEQTTIKEFTESLLGANAQLKEGMQLTLIMAMYNDDGDKSTSEVMASELTLSKSDTRTIGEVWKLGSFGRDNNGYLGITGLSEDSWGAWILSDSTTGTLRVSSETMVPGDSGPFVEHSSDDYLMQAMESYGLDPDIFLASGDYNP